EEPDDYVLATGDAHSVRQFVMRAFEQIGIEIEWEGDLEDEVGRDAKSGKVLVEVDANLYRPNEVNYLLGDASKARKVLGWTPKVSFDELVAEMVNADRAALHGEEGG